MRIEPASKVDRFRFTQTEIGFDVYGTLYSCAVPNALLAAVPASSGPLLIKRASGWHKLPVAIAEALRPILFGTKSFFEVATQEEAIWIERAEEERSKRQDSDRRERATAFAPWDGAAPTAW